MAGNLSPLRALRPVLLAGAAALTWLTFSASTASADTLPDATTLLGGVTASVSSVTEKLPVPVPEAPAAAPVSSPGLPAPLAGEVSGLADHLVASVPVVNQVVPAGTVSVISLPVAQAADAVTAKVAEAVVPPVTEALPVLEPVLQPVSDLVTGSALLPVELPEVPLASGDDERPAGAGTATAGTGVAPGEAGSPAHTSDIPFVEAAGATGTAPVGAALAQASAASWGSVAGSDSAQELPTADPSPTHAQAPAVPASGTGSSASSAGSSGGAACLNAFSFDPAASGALHGVDVSEHAPAPVSFDPGSRPD